MPDSVFSTAEHRSSEFPRTPLEERKIEAEIAKLRMETDNLKRSRSSESARFWVTVLAPLIGSGAVVATLIFQIVQFNENLRETRKAAEATEFRETLQSFQSTAPSGAKAAIAESRLKSFLDSSALKLQVRSSLVSVLAAIADPAEFNRLFKKLFPTINHENLPELVQIAQTQRTLLEQAEYEQSSAKNALDNAKLEPQKILAQSRLDQANNEVESFDESFRLISDPIAKIMRERIPGANDDLSFAELWRANFNNADFSGVDIEGAWFEHCTVEGADLSRIRLFEGASWYGTQWWLAKSIRAELGACEVIEPRPLPRHGLRPLRLISAFLHESACFSEGRVLQI